MERGERLRLAGRGVRGWISDSARAFEVRPQSLKTAPWTPPPGMQSIPPKCVPKPKLGNEGQTRGEILSPFQGWTFWEATQSVALGY
jgi:hypothetical protein